MKGPLPADALLDGTYQLAGILGVGGFGAVYEATHARLGGRVAVKVLREDVAQHTVLVARFHREAEITARLRHPNIVQVLDFNTTAAGLPYLVMELLEGEDLGRVFRRRRVLPVNDVLDIIDQVAAGLMAAHETGVVHRDLKPENVFLARLPGEDRVVAKIVDFGISKVHEATTMLTAAAAVMGTPSFMAPEQAKGLHTQIDPRTDQFALAAIAYEALTGTRAFKGDSADAILYQVVHEQPASLRTMRPELSSAVEAVVFRGLSKRREHRFPDVRAFAQALLRAASGEVSAPPQDFMLADTLRGDQATGPTPATRAVSPVVLRPSRGLHGWRASAIAAAALVVVAVAVTFRTRGETPEKTGAATRVDAALPSSGAGGSRRHPTAAAGERVQEVPAAALATETPPRTRLEAMTSPPGQVPTPVRRRRRTGKAAAAKAARLAEPAPPASPTPVPVRDGLLMEL
jgi:serine/threonine-protein kinase